jgi:hypothetical protein
MIHSKFVTIEVEEAMTIDEWITDEWTVQGRTTPATRREIGREDTGQ